MLSTQFWRIRRENALDFPAEDPHLPLRPSDPNVTTTNAARIVSGSAALGVDPGSVISNWHRGDISIGAYTITLISGKVAALIFWRTSNDNPVTWLAPAAL